MKALALTRHEDLLAVFTANELNDEQTRFLLSRRAQLADELSRITGRTIRIDLQLPGQQGQPTAENPSGIAPPSRTNVPVSLQDAMTLPLVRQVMNIFNASIMEVHRDETNLPQRPAAALPDPDADPDAPLDPSEEAMLDPDE
jgi:hypothetical protein